MHSINYYNIKEASATCFGTCVPSSGRTKGQFKKLLPLKRCYVVVAALLLTLINYKRHNSTDF